jgi:hypothetical protein
MRHNKTKSAITEQANHSSTHQAYSIPPDSKLAPWPDSRSPIGHGFIRKLLIASPFSARSAHWPHLAAPSAMAHLWRAISLTLLLLVGSGGANAYPAVPVFPPDTGCTAVPCYEWHALDVPGNTVGVFKTYAEACAFTTAGFQQGGHCEPWSDGDNQYYDYVLPLCPPAGCSGPPPASPYVYHGMGGRVLVNPSYYWCPGGGTLDSSALSCQCNTSRENDTGSACECKPGFAHPDGQPYHCSTLKIVDSGNSPPTGSAPPAGVGPSPGPSPSTADSGGGDTGGGSGSTSGDSTCRAPSVQGVAP